MADTQSGQTGGSSGTAKGGSSGSSAGGSSGSGAGVADQATETLRNATDRVSDAWDSASEYGSRYYRQGSRAIGNADSGTMTGWLVAGAIGLGLGWLAFGQRSYSGDYIPRRMSRSSDRDY
jgi:hypothetical protein